MPRAVAYTVPAMIAEADAWQIAESWIAAWNAHDLDAILNHYTDDIVVTSPLVVRRLGRPDGTIRGKAALREYFAIGLRNAPTLHFSLQHVLAGVDGLTILYRRESGALAADVVTLGENSKVRRARSYYHGLPAPSPQ